MLAMMRAVLRSLLVVSLFAGSAAAADAPAKDNVTSTAKTKKHHKAKVKRARKAKRRHKSHAKHAM
jgi:TolA-binding protein